MTDWYLIIYHSFSTWKTISFISIDPCALCLFTAINFIPSSQCLILIWWAHHMLISYFSSSLNFLPFFYAIFLSNSLLTFVNCLFSSTSTKQAWIFEANCNLMLIILSLILLCLLFWKYQAYRNKWSSFLKASLFAHRQKIHYCLL